MLRCVLFLLAVLLVIPATSAILHTQTFNVEDLGILLPSAILATAPFLIEAIEAALHLPPIGSVALSFVVACLCIALYVYQLGVFGNDRTEERQGGMELRHGAATPPLRSSLANG
jgi:hypothetical protein